MHPLGLFTVYLVIHPLFIYASHSRPIAAVVSIVFLWTVNCIVKTIFLQLLFIV